MLEGIIEKSKNLIRKGKKAFLVGTTSLVLLVASNNGCVSGDFLPDLSPKPRFIPKHQYSGFILEKINYDIDLNKTIQTPSGLELITTITKLSSSIQEGFKHGWETEPQRASWTIKILNEKPCEIEPSCDIKIHCNYLNERIVRTISKSLLKNGKEVISSTPIALLDTYGPSNLTGKAKSLLMYATEEDIKIEVWGLAQNYTHIEREIKPTIEWTPTELTEGQIIDMLKTKDCSRLYQYTVENKTFNVTFTKIPKEHIKSFIDQEINSKIKETIVIIQDSNSHIGLHDVKLEMKVDAPSKQDLASNYFTGKLLDWAVSQINDYKTGEFSQYTDREGTIRFNIYTPSKFKFETKHTKYHAFEKSTTFEDGNLEKTIRLIDIGQKLRIEEAEKRGGDLIEK